MWSKSNIRSKTEPVGAAELVVDGIDEKFDIFQVELIDVDGALDTGSIAFFSKSSTGSRQPVKDKDGNPYSMTVAPAPNGTRSFQISNGSAAQIIAIPTALGGGGATQFKIKVLPGRKG